MSHLFTNKLMLTELRRRKIIQELNFSASRSSGPGGQHVNKVNTKIELRFSINDSEVLSGYEKNVISLKLSNKLTTNLELIITVQTTRSQLKNKKEAIEKFILLINMALTPVRQRKATKPTHASRRKRIENKKQLSLKKNMRRKPNLF